MKKAVFLYNPMSGDRSITAKLDYIIGRFMEEEVLIQPFRLVEDSEEKLVSLMKEGFAYAVVAGGDGTLNNVVNSFVKNNINVPIGIIPSGTANDFARSLNIPHDLKRCLDIVLQGKIKEVDIGIVNGKKYFLGTCAGGLFVNVSFNTSSELKRSFGPLAYYLKALSEVKNLKPFEVNVRTDSSTIDEEILVFLILNGKDVAGFTNIVEEADISDGLMDIVLIKSCLHIDLAALFFKVLTNDFINDKNVIKLKSKTCYIDAKEDIAITIDGEKADGLPMDVKFINKALKVFVD